MITIEENELKPRSSYLILELFPVQDFRHRPGEHNEGRRNTFPLSDPTAGYVSKCIDKTLYFFTKSLDVKVSQKRINFNVLLMWKTKLPHFMIPAISPFINFMAVKHYRSQSNVMSNNLIDKVIKATPRIHSRDTPISYSKKEK
jgi:hypothetical protein